MISHAIRALIIQSRDFCMYLELKLPRVLKQLCLQSNFVLALPLGIYSDPGTYVIVGGASMRFMLLLLLGGASMSSCYCKNSCSSMNSLKPHPRALCH